VKYPSLTSINVNWLSPPEAGEHLNLSPPEAGGRLKKPKSSEVGSGCYVLGLQESKSLNSE